MKNEIIAKLRSLNTGRIGSFGEYVFEQNCLKTGVKVRRYFRERTDFLVGESEKRIDVKTTLKLADEPFRNNFSSYGGTKIKGIDYVCINLHSDCLVFSLEGSPYFDRSNIIEMKEVEELFGSWRTNKKNTKIFKDNEFDKKMKESLNNMKTRVKDYFQKEGLDVKIIHRTCQRIFGAESPDNLLPYVKDKITPKENNIKIFVDYNDPEILDENIYQIIAFPETKHEELSRLPVVRVLSGKKNRQKVDLDKIDEKFVFTGIKDLLSDNYKKMFR